MLDLRTSQDQLEDLLRDAILYALGRRVASVASVAALRAFVTQGATGPVVHNDSLAVIVVSGVVTSSFRWSNESTATDDGVNVVKPTDAGVTGRWLLWTSNIRFVPVIGGDSFYLHELTQGPIERVIVLDKAMSQDEISQLIQGQVPSVLIEAANDKPDDMTLNTGHLYDTQYEFTTSVITQNLRDRRQATHGSSLDGTKGANLLDGFVKALLAGTNLTAAESGIRNIQIGRGMNWFSGEAQRRVIRSRGFTLQVTEELPAAPNDAGPVEEVDFQAQIASMGEQDSPFDTKNYVSSGMTVSEGSGLVKPVAAGTAQFADVTVTYAGELKTFSVNVDTYRDLLSDGTMTFVEAAYDDVPAVTANALRIGVTRTDGSGVVSDRFIAETLIDFGPTYEIPLT